MKVLKKNNYLVSVANDGKVTGLYWSESLVELNTIKRLHKSEDVGIMDMRGYFVEDSEAIKKIITKVSFTKNGKPYANRVRCVETGVIYDSVEDASSRLGIPKSSIDASIYRHIAAYGYHFEQLPPIQKFLELNGNK